MKNKIISYDELLRLVEKERKNNKKIVWTNGCFDILHAGHVRYLKQAKEQGDILILGLNSDSSVRKLKGEGRPFQNQDDRAEILSEFPFIDYIMIFDEPNVEKYLKTLKPDVYVKGGDYSIDNIDQNERKIIESYGGKIVLINVGKDSHTSEIIKQMKQNGKV